LQPRPAGLPQPVVSIMKLIVGLGNPGTKYAGNRHNVGFMAVDRLYEAHDFQPWRKRFSGEMAEGRVGSERCLLLKPQTYMNESGRSVGEAMRFYKLDLEDVFVVYDEIDLAPGKLKAKIGGGNAGHNGLRSISNHIGNEYQRVRIGVGRPADKAQVANYVLRDFTKADQDWLDPMLPAIADAFPLLLKEGSARFLTEVARRIGPTEREQPAAQKTAGPDASATKAAKKVKQTAPKNTDKPEEGAMADLLRRWKSNEKDGD
jgi:PTH1 family peptidyl-tRNA hydrolase